MQLDLRETGEGCGTGQPQGAGLGLENTRLMRLLEMLLRRAGGGFVGSGTVAAKRYRFF